MNTIDINFDFYSDTPKNKDPDSFSPRLRKYHQVLWSKPLPSGVNFHLDLNTPKLLHHISELGEFFLSSDSIGHTYSEWKRMSHIIGEFELKELKPFYFTCSTIGAYLIFPAKRIDNKMTINGARGVNHKIHDRFDLTLECIRRFYLKEKSPLSDVLERYANFFNLFDNFRGYVDFFLLQDLVEKDYLAIKFWSVFDYFDSASRIPNNKEEYLRYKTKVIDFVNARGQRMLKTPPVKIP